MRDWPAFVEHVVRLARPGALIVLNETSFPFTKLDQVQGELERVAPGFAAYHEVLVQ